MNWETVKLVLLIIGAIWIIIGIIRVIFSPYRGFWGMIGDFLLLDWLGDILGGIGDIISDMDFDSDSD